MLIWIKEIENQREKNKKIKIIFDQQKKIKKFESKFKILKKIKKKSVSDKQYNKYQIQYNKQKKI